MIDMLCSSSHSTRNEQREGRCGFQPSRAQLVSRVCPCIYARPISHLQFEDVRGAESAIRVLNNFEVGGLKLIVKSADADTDEKASVLESDNLYVKGLPLAMSQERLHNLFSTYGNVTQLKILTRPGQESTGEVGILPLNFSPSMCAFAGAYPES